MADRRTARGVTRTSKAVEEAKWRRARQGRKGNDFDVKPKHWRGFAAGGLVSYFQNGGNLGPRRLRELEYNQTDYLNTESILSQQKFEEYLQSLPGPDMRGTGTGGDLSRPPAASLPTQYIKPKRTRGAVKPSDRWWGAARGTREAVKPEADMTLMEIVEGMYDGMRFSSGPPGGSKMTPKRTKILKGVKDFSKKIRKSSGGLVSYFENGGVVNEPYITPEQAALIKKHHGRELYKRIMADDKKRRREDKAKRRQVMDSRGRRLDDPNRVAFSSEVDLSKSIGGKTTLQGLDVMGSAFSAVGDFGMTAGEWVAGAFGVGRDKPELDTGTRRATSLGQNILNVGTLGFARKKGWGGFGDDGQTAQERFLTEKKEDRLRRSPLSGINIPLIGNVSDDPLDWLEGAGNMLVEEGASLGTGIILRHLAKKKAASTAASKFKKKYSDIPMETPKGQTSRLHVTDGGYYVEIDRGRAADIADKLWEPADFSKAVGTGGTTIQSPLRSAGAAHKDFLKNKENSMRAFSGADDDTLDILPVLLREKKEKFFKQLSDPMADFPGGMPKSFGSPNRLPEVPPIPQKLKDIVGGAGRSPDNPLSLEQAEKILGITGAYKAAIEGGRFKQHGIEQLKKKFHTLPESVKKHLKKDHPGVVDPGEINAADAAEELASGRAYLDSLSKDSPSNYEKQLSGMFSGNPAARPQKLGGRKQFPVEAFDKNAGVRQFLESFQRQKKGFNKHYPANVSKGFHLAGDYDPITNWPKIMGFMDKPKGWKWKWPPDPSHNAQGGLIRGYAEGGSIFTPQGTDTVPAMLTPGEFVIQKTAVDALGTSFLNAINSVSSKSSKPRGFKKGGGVEYLQQGGLKGPGSPMTLDSSKFDKAVQDFSSAIGDLQTAFKGGFAFSHTGTINIVVTLDDTASIFSAAKGSFESIAADKVAEGVNSALKEHFPDLPRSTFQGDISPAGGMGTV